MSYEYDVCIMGAGHVGLPLSMAFADKGLNVYAYDISEPMVKIVTQGKMPFMEEGGEELLKKVLSNGKLKVSTNPEGISKSENIIITIGTPTDTHLSPEPTVEETVEAYSKYFVDGQLIILRSTIHPGTTERVATILKRKNKKIDVAFCPERIVQGYALKELVSFPHIVSATSDTGLERATTLFKKLNADIVVLSPLEAELAKLFCNAWRYITFAAGNQFFLIANDAGADFYKIQKAISFNYPRMKAMPGPGFTAGPCLYKDTVHIQSFAKQNFHLGNAAILVNESLPTYIIDRLKRTQNLKEKTVGILGMAFKADNDDKRDSLSYNLKRLLKYEAKDVLCTDVYIKDPELITPDELIKKSDIIIVATPHKEYKSLKFDSGKEVVDVWNFYGKGGVI